MVTRTPSVFVWLLSAVLVLTAVAAAPADTLKNKKTGEVLKGRLLDQRVNQRHIFRPDLGGTLYLDMREWEVVERGAPAQPPAAKPGPKATGPNGTPHPADAGTAPTAEDGCVFILPITGAIDHPCLAEAVRQAIAEARTRHAKVVVLRVDTPGGLVTVADTIIRLLEEVTWAPTVSWVKGDVKGALSAGAYICLATKQILMAPGTTIGAATPFTRSETTGSVQVDEKFKSAFSARFRSLAQQLGHSSVIAHAMVDNSVSAVQVVVDGQSRIVTAEEADRLEAKHKNEAGFRRKTIVQAGQLLTLTSAEAVDFGVACGLADTKDALLKQLAMEGVPVVEAAWLPDWVERTSKRRNAEIDKWFNQFAHQLQQAAEEDPRLGSYYVSEVTGQFSDGGTRWREHTDRALRHLKVCAQALTELEKLAKDERYRFPVDQAAFDRMKMRMDALYKRLHRERTATAP